MAALTLACQASPTPSGAPSPDLSGFSSERAWAHLVALAEIGPRVTGSRGASRARRYLRSQLEETGATVSEVHVPVGPVESQPGVEAVHVVALLPGDSADRFMLAAAYDTPRLADSEFIGANASGSGPAVVLELARVLSRRPRPYTLMVVLLDGDFASGETPVERTERTFEGSRQLARVFDEQGTLAGVRLAAFFQQVGDADLSIVRDLRSHTIYRDVVFEVAAKLGYERSFRRDAPLESPAGSHQAFIEVGLSRVVVISDDRYGGSDRPGRYAWSEQDTLEHCSAASLAAVGDVALGALDSIASRLARMDRFPGESPAEPEGPSSGMPASRSANPRDDAASTRPAPRAVDSGRPASR